MSLRILVVRLGAMGDVLHALPAVASLRHSFPGSHITWAVEPRWGPLIAGNPCVDEILPVLRRGLREILATRRRLRAGRPDIAIDFQGLIKSAIVASAARPDRIYGFHRTQAREKLASFIYSHPVQTRSSHVVDRNLELAQAAGATNLLRTFHVPPGAPEGELPPGDFVLACPQAGWTSKQWPMEYYSELGRRLRVPLVLNGPGPISAPNTVPHVSGLAGLIDATRRACAVVGVDSGPLHLAAALGKPGVAVYGPTDPARNGPYGDSITVLRAPDAATTYAREARIAASMRAISPEAVYQSLISKLSQAAAT